MSIEKSQEPKELLYTSSNAEEFKKIDSDSQYPRRSSIKKKDNITSKPTFEEKLSNTMFTYTRETICVFLAVVLTALAALHSSPPKISKPPIARPFFNESSIILDYYKGHLGALVNRLMDSDFSFIMYYAPWDAESQTMKIEFETVAQYYHSQVFFAAINCWHPGSECRSRYSKIQSYPVLMFYPSGDSGIQYKGILKAPYMIHFIKTFMNPIIRVSSDEQLIKLLKSYDAVMIGYFQFSGLKKTPGYREFFRTALRLLEKDPNGEIAFVAITNKTIVKEHGVFEFPAASLLLWNETLFYPDNHKWLADDLSSWINNVIHRVVTWLQPPGIKSLTFAPYLWDGPVLFLFTPRNPLHFKNNNYNLLKEIGLQYYDCSENLQIQDLVSRLHKSRLESSLKTFEKREWCTKVLEEGNYLQNSLTGFLMNRANHDRSLNKTANCCSDIPTNKCVICAKLNDALDSMCAAPSAFCRLPDIFSKPFAFIETKSDIHQAFQHVSSHFEMDDNCSINSCGSSENDEGIDSQSASAVKKEYYREECRRFLAGYSYQRPIFPVYVDNENSVDVKLTDAICKINKTLALVAIDSLQYFYFAESLGINIADTNDKTAVVILDPADESQYVMQEDFGRNTLVQFINNYTNGELTRTMRSNNPKLITQSFATKSKWKQKTKSEIYISELSTETFLDTVLDPKKDIVVLYHSPYCAFCSAVAYVYLTVANYLSKMNHLKFVRIDGDNNDLPWEYTMNRYPSILFFPAKRKEDSTLYPWTLPISVGNLLNFVLANLDEESHIEALVNICAAGATGSPEACLSRTRLLCLDVLEEHLRDYRRLYRLRLQNKQNLLVDNQMRIVMLKLEHIRDVHLTLGTSDDLAGDVETAQLLRKKFKSLYAKLANLQRNGNKSKFCDYKTGRYQLEQNT